MSNKIHCDNCDKTIIYGTTCSTALREELNKQYTILYTVSSGTDDKHLCPQCLLKMLQDKYSLV